MCRKSFGLLLLLLAVAVQGTAASADAKADGLMRQVIAATRRTRSLSAVLTVRLQTDGAAAMIRTGKIYLQKPNLAHVELPLDFGGIYAAVNSDGKRLWERAADNSSPDGIRYRSRPADPQGKNIRSLFALPVAFFFDPAAPLTTMFAVDKVSGLHYAGRKMIGGVTYDVIEQTVLQPHIYTVRLYISPDKRLDRVETDMPPSVDSPHHTCDEADISRVHVNQRIPAQMFAFTPASQLSSSTSPGSESRLPALGTSAPDFSLTNLSGKVVTLAEALRGRKAIYLDFWFCECMACRHEFPALQKLYTEYKAQGLEVYAVNAFDDARKVRRFKSQMDLLRSATFPVLLSGPGDPTGEIKKYGVDAYPSGVLIGAGGKILFTSVGYDDKPGLGDLRAALVKAGMSRQ